MVRAAAEAPRSAAEEDTGARQALVPDSGETLTAKAAAKGGGCDATGQGKQHCGDTGAVVRCCSRVPPYLRFISAPISQRPTSEIVDRYGAAGIEPESAVPGAGEIANEFVGRKNDEGDDGGAPGEAPALAQVTHSPQVEDSHEFPGVAPCANGGDEEVERDRETFGDEPTTAEQQYFDEFRDGMYECLHNTLAAYDDTDDDEAEDALPPVPEPGDDAASQAQPSPPEGAAQSDDSPAILPLVSAKQFKFESFLKLFGFLQRLGSKRMAQDGYRMVTPVCGVTIANSDVLQLFTWRKNDLTNPSNPELPLASLQLNRAAHLLPSLATIKRSMPAIFKYLTLPMRKMLVTVDTSKAGARVVARHHALKDGTEAYEVDSNPASEVGFVAPREIIKADVMTSVVCEKMKSTSKSQAPAGAECIDGNYLFHGRNHVYGDNLSVNAIRPLLPRWKDSVATNANPDSAWRWSHAGVGETVLVETQEKLMECLTPGLSACDACSSHVARNKANGGPY